MDVYGEEAGGGYLDDGVQQPRLLGQHALHQARLKILFVGFTR